MIEITLTSTKDLLLIFSSLFAIFLLWILIWKGSYEIYIKSKEEKIDERLSKAEEKAEKIIENAYKKANQQIKYIEKLEENLLLKAKTLEVEKQNIEKLKTELEKTIEKEKKELEKIAYLSSEEAKNLLFNKIKQQYKNDLEKLKQKYKKIQSEEIKNLTTDIISRALPRISMDITSQLTTTTIDIPNENFKAKLIWKQGRNIIFFEKLLWVELIIDDSPKIIRISHYDPEKRFIAENVIKNLIQDSIVNPIYIKKYYEKAKLNLDELLIEKWKEALEILNIWYLHEDIVKLIWKFYLRYSYWQNLWTHSIEVAKIAELIANELWLDWYLAKKAWLLHDIGKVITSNLQSHAKAGWDLLRKYDLDPIIINAAESHHMEIEPNHPISWIIAAADSISASRPGARFNTKELFLEKMQKLEKLIYEIPWIKQVNIYQAWRQIRIFVNPNEISDDQLENINKLISKKIENNIDFPGIIQITTIRENKVETYLS